MSESVDDLIRGRLRAIRQHLGWSLDDLAERSGVGASTISRIETGNRSISFDVLVPLARELDVTVDELVASEPQDDVVMSPEPVKRMGRTTWLLSRPSSQIVALKVRLEPNAPESEPRVHPGHDWMFVIDGTVCLTLGDRQIVVQTGESAEFNTMTPHAFAAIDNPAEAVMIFDRDGARTHLTDD
jgi:transcriptional regulator with XRE-family HTH domain